MNLGINIGTFIGMKNESFTVNLKQESRGYFLFSLPFILYPTTYLFINITWNQLYIIFMPNNTYKFNPYNNTLRSKSL